MGVVDRHSGGAGQSGMRQYNELAHDWRRRTLGRRTGLYFWSLFVLAVVAAYERTPMAWRFEEGLVLGMIGAGYVMLPDTVIPDHIARWQRGAWGEQNTAKALRPLKEQGWLVRHDLATGDGQTNRDHIAVGTSVYLLDSKMLKDEVWVDEAGLHVRRLDASRSEYAVPAPTRAMSGAARALEHDLYKSVGFPVAVYPVVVIWGHFAAGVQWDKGVAYVSGDKILQWLTERKVDLPDERKRAAVCEWLRALPAA